MLDRLKDILSRVVTGINMNDVNEDTTLVGDLGFDSLSMMMMAMELEDAFGFRFTEFVKFETVGDVCRFVEMKATK